MFTPGDSFPYIGLRPFSEDDSLYFKGRDEQILQLTALLEANKFLMVTGASGDGKSSLVYAGLVPNARAGFFRATHSNWVVADFRPERRPLHNLAKTISRNLLLGNEESVEVELRRGFSSLVEIYKSSALYLDDQSQAWKEANEEQREDLQRNAANLLIVADQFEEFFTNPENYYRNAPSADSQLVINLLLETARISIEKNLSIYIVCTMRSDYIGQCASFRGLPEFIGFSQFFVPRLKRKEMVQVIKEPAHLHGDRISDRLVERVVYDLGEGIDQLPVLEHAMNEVWIMASQGQEELDLVHYAMAGGMPPKDLPAEDRGRFEAWFKTLPAKFREAYLHPGLSQIIDTHANKLYLSAGNRYNETLDTKISDADAQLIVKVAFTCLTKMDEGRAVRNRMTLQEITDILARPELTPDVVGGVLNIFREPGNTFLRPHISEDPESLKLTPESVLDVTHESLIRNWDLLLTWAKEEYDHLTVYEDFKKQLDRWTASKKSRGFLLPIGPLTFFENWHTTLNPNQYWINRYLDPGVDKETRLQQAAQIIEETREFLARSARKVRFTRLVVKYGASRIAAVAGTIAIIALCGFYYWDAQRKLNANVVKTMLTEGRAQLPDPRLDIVNKGRFLILSEFLEPGSYVKAMNKIPADQQFDLIRETYTNPLYFRANPPLRRFGILYGDSLVRAVPLRKTDPVFLMERLKALNVLVKLSSHYLYSQDDQRIQEILEFALRQTKEILAISFNQKFKPELLHFDELDDGIENVLNYNILSREDVAQLLKTISPFESHSARETFNAYFPVDKQLTYSGNLVKRNAGFQQLAYLYAYTGKLETVKSCVDSLIKDHPNYATFRDNILNIATVLFKGKHVNETDALLAYYAQKQKVSKKELYELWLNCSGYRDQYMAEKLPGKNHNNNLELMDLATVKALFDLYYAVLQTEYYTADDFNFNLALYFKHRGIILSKIDTDKGGRFGINPDSLFSLSVDRYKKVSEEYLNQETEVYAENSFRRMVKSKRKRKTLFLYPDHVQKVLNSRWYPPRYYTDRFFTFLLNKGFFTDLYRDEKDLGLLHDWIRNYNLFNQPSFPDRNVLNYTPLRSGTLKQVDSIFTNNPHAAGINANLERLLLISDAIDQGQDIEALYAKLDFLRLKENLRESDDLDQLCFAWLMQRLTSYLAQHGRRTEATRLIQSHPNPINVLKGYAMAPIDLLNSEKGSREDAYVYLDSALTGFNRITDFFFLSEDPRISFILPLNQIGGKEMDELARTYVTQLSIGQQDGAFHYMVLGKTLRGEYYEAYSAIPRIALDHLYYFNIILTSEALKKAQDKEWSTYFNTFQQYFTWWAIRYEPEVL